MEEFLNRREVFRELRRTVVRGQKSFVVKFDQLLEYDMALARDLLDNPNDFLSRADGILEGITKIPGMRLRVRGLDRSWKPDEIRAGDIGKFIEVEGTVSRAGELKFIGRKEGEPEYRDPYRDYQRIQINGLDVDLTNELVGEANEGNKVIATGILKTAPASEEQLILAKEDLWWLSKKMQEIAEKNPNWSAYAVFEEAAAEFGPARKLLVANHIVLPDKETCERGGGIWDGVSCVKGSVEFRAEGGLKVGGS